MTTNAFNFKKLGTATPQQIKLYLKPELGTDKNNLDVWTKISQMNNKKDIIRELMEMPMFADISESVKEYADASAHSYAMKRSANYEQLHKLAKELVAMPSPSSPSTGAGLQALEIINPQFDNDNQLWLGTPLAPQVATKPPSNTAPLALTINVTAAFGAMGRRSAFVVYGLPNTNQPSHLKDVGWLVSSTGYGVFAHFGKKNSSLPAALQNIAAERRHDWNLYTQSLPCYLRISPTVASIKAAFSLMLSNSCEKENELTADSRMTMPPELAAIGRIARKCNALRSKMQLLYSQLAKGLHVALQQGQQDLVKSTWAGLVAVCEVYLMTAKLLQASQCTPGIQAAVFVTAAAIPHMRVLLEACGFVVSDIV